MCIFTRNAPVYMVNQRPHVILGKQVNIWCEIDGCIHTHAHTHACTRIHTHTQTHTHTHTTSIWTAY